MIYLFEDKTARRSDYDWTNSKLEQYNDSIVAIENYEDFKSNKQYILNSESIVLYHESFINCIDFCYKDEVNSIIEQLESNGNKIAFFSGSKNQRTLRGNICDLSPSILYPNLELFINKSRSGDTNFKYLLFGENPDLEDKLRRRINDINSSNASLSKKYTNKNLFVFIESELSLDFPFENAESDRDFDFECDDENLCVTISNNLNNKKFDAIYVPLCFGETFSDFMGLRLAMLIRFSNTANRFTPIVIYGEADYSDLLNNECFDILKMPGIYYIHSDYNSLEEILSQVKDINWSEYNNGIKNIHLNIPTNIGDNHSVSNKWAIYKWSEVLGVNNSEIDENNSKVFSNIYFLYLAALHATKNSDVISEGALKIKCNTEQPLLKILYVDDQADEGWYELLCSILYDNNKFEFEYIGEEIKSKSQNEIIDIVRSKVLDFNPNLIILDLRLHLTDFGNTPIEDITGYKILKEIKKINRGIQVIIFSATNKIWNLQRLTVAEADGFIVKESPADSNDEKFTIKTIEHFVSCMKKSAFYTYRVKLWQDIQKDKQILDYNKHEIGEEYANTIKSLLMMAEDSMFAQGMEYSFAATFMNFFRIIEASANHLIKEDYDDVRKKYCYYFDDDHSVLYSFNTKKFSRRPLGELTFNQKGNIPYAQKIANLLYHANCYSEKAHKLASKRNNFEHPKEHLSNFTVSDIIDLYDIVHKLIINQK